MVKLAQKKTKMIPRIAQELKKAMQLKQTARVSILRLMLVALREKDKIQSLSDNEAISILNKMLNQINKSLDMFRAGNRDDLVKQAEYEIRWVWQSR